LLQQLSRETRALHEQVRPGIVHVRLPDVVWIDPLVWARELYKEEKSNRLTDVCARLGIALEQAHRAAGDAEATGRVLLALAERLPQPYGELIRLQGQMAARQDVDKSMLRNRRF
jgi:DNA polymerase III subunit epsilon